MNKIELDEDTHTYTVDGVVVPSVSEKIETVLGGFKDLPEWLLAKIRAKAKKGRVVHKIISLDLKGEDVVILDDSLKGWWESYGLFKEDAHLKCEESEHMAFDQASNTCMTIDYYGYSFFRKSLLDWKTGGTYKSYKPQLGYYLKFLMNSGKDVDLVGCVKLDEKGKKGKLIEYEPLEIIKDAEAIDRIYNIIKSKGL